MAHFYRYTAMTMAKSYCTRLDKREKINLKDFDHDAPKGVTKSEMMAEGQKLGVEMEELFDLLSYAGTHGLLIVLQGIDTSGKDGTIRHILQYSHAQNCRVSSFKVPTSLELSHDFLWRVHPHAPPRGGISVFNRSHYEDIVVTRVHNLITKDVRDVRSDRIREFEKLVSDHDTIVLKFFLHISKHEQEERLLAREANVDKSWKLSVGDWQERELWSKYMDAYGDAIGETAASHAPWFIVPGNEKWYRDLAVTQAIVAALKPLKKEWRARLEKIGDVAKRELAAYRQGLTP